jgi:two-component system, sensor histidine kinase and response regulator
MQDGRNLVPDSPRILIVDDEAPQMKALCDTLHDRGYETVGFTSAAQALVALQDKQFDLLLSDLMMPGMDGISLLQSALKIQPDLVAIIMTGQGTIDTAVEAMKTGALDYILKPFKLSFILPVLGRALAVRRLRIQNAELEKKVRERTAELEVANKDLEGFSYSVSHDLRAPLRAIDGFSNLLLKNFSANLPSDAQRLLSNVMASARDMRQLIDDLLDFSRLSRQPLTKQHVAVSNIVHQVLEELRPEQAGREIEVRASGIADCTGDPSLLKQVFVNLLSNAFKFTKKQDRAIIEIGSRQQNEETVYFVRDNGAGFDMQYAERLFGVFQRLHRKEEFEGTGVGLSIVQRIVQRHGGRIWAEAAVGKGATFYFTLPG